MLELGNSRLLILLSAKQLLDLSQVAIDGEVLPGQLLDDLVLALDVLAQAVVFFFNGSLLFKDLHELLLNDLLLLCHLRVRRFDFLLHLLTVLAAELKLLLELEDVARARFDSCNVLFLGLELSTQCLHLSVVALNLTLEKLLVELRLSQLLLELAVLANE